MKCFGFSLSVGEVVVGVAEMSNARDFLSFKDSDDSNKIQEASSGSSEQIETGKWVIAGQVKKNRERRE